MVAAHEEEFVRPPELEDVEVEQALARGCLALRLGWRRWRTHLDAKAAAIDVVAEKEVVRVCERPADLEDLHQVILRARVRGGATTTGRRRARARRTYWPWMSPTTARRQRRRRVGALHAPVTGLLTRSTLGSAARTSVA
jgi:hypothetical protein